MYQISISNEDIEKLPLTTFGGTIVVVEHPGKLYNEALKYFKSQSIIGFDTESKPVFEPHQKSNGVALVQLSGPDKAYLFRVKKLGMRRGLAEILGNKDILKIGAAVGDDIRRLKRDFGFTPESFVDLQQIGWEYGIRDKSVKKLAANILGIKISKSQQLSNWEAEPLSEAQQKYGAMDAWVCREMYLKLLESEKHPLTEEERNPNQFLQQQKAREERELKKAEEEKKREELAAQKTAEKKKKKKSRNAAARRKYYLRKKKKKKLENNGQGNIEERS